MAIGPNSAAPLVLSGQGREIAFAGKGGFHIYDATSRAEVPLPNGVVRATGAAAEFAVTASGLRLQATFTPQENYVLVSGWIENTRSDERGFIVDYRLPPFAVDATFAGDFGAAARIAGAAAREENVFPIAAMGGARGGVAMAIPPSEPRVFGMVGDAQGMATRFYLGTSPRTVRFPNRASFVFIIYPVDPAEGFRGALARYYGFFPDYYRPRLRHPGLFMFQMGDRVPRNVAQYGLDLIEPQWDPQVLGAAIARDEEYGIAKIPYLIVGQREIKFLPRLPRDYDAAMAVFQHWTVADLAGHMLTKENAASGGDVHLKEEVESSACTGPDGRYSLELRKTRWGGNSVTFIMNPNPELFAGERRRVVGRDALELGRRWLAEHPEYDGLYVDSVGANWPAVLNYRHEHFTYAEYPLTFDPEGRVALQNTLSHYEYIAALRRWMRAQGRLVVANGIYAYDSRGDRGGPGKPMKIRRGFDEYIAARALPEYYRAGTRVGRFFCASLLDFASSELGVGASVRQCREIRAFLGRKPYALLNYHWRDQARVETFVNRCLAFDLFASSTTNQFDGTEYEDNPDGYLRDRKLLNWFVPLARDLAAAGWEPVRHATVEGAEISCERFGRRGVVYFTLYNDSTAVQPCRLQIDLPALGFRDDAVIAEIARQADVQRVGARQVQLLLPPQRTCVLAVSSVTMRP
ncbi:MAG TPA: hypothetical protein VHE61_08365 [Opitutaceae bacterium]|nr:hypothetical protein [Opitutaceae bacterium]